MELLQLMCFHVFVTWPAKLHWTVFYTRDYTSFLQWAIKEHDSFSLGLFIFQYRMRVTYEHNGSNLTVCSLQNVFKFSICISR